MKYRVIAPIRSKVRMQALETHHSQMAWIENSTRARAPLAAVSGLPRASAGQRSWRRARPRLWNRPTGLRGSSAVASSPGASANRSVTHEEWLDKLGLPARARRRDMSLRSSVGLSSLRHLTQSQKAVKLVEHAALQVAARSTRPEPAKRPFWAFRGDDREGDENGFLHLPISWGRQGAVAGLGDDGYVLDIARAARARGT
jgi:hypothetical protein